MDNVGLKKRTLCAANPRSRKATISSFFKSLALRFSFSVCCRTCLRVLFREGLVVLRVASVTLYDAGDADIFSVEGEGSKHTRGRANGAFLSRKVSKNSCVFWCCAFFAFFIVSCLWLSFLVSCYCFCYGFLVMVIVSCFLIMVIVSCFLFLVS
mgnify:CR=1 FL=1